MYKKDDIVGVATDAMYEFKIVKYHEDQEMYEAICTKSYMPSVEVGETRGIKPSQILVKLGENGDKWDCCNNLTE